jgi:hypothetical protein
MHADTMRSDGWRYHLLVIVKPATSTAIFHEVACGQGLKNPIGTTVETSGIELRHENGVPG